VTERRKVPDSEAPTLAGDGPAAPGPLEDTARGVRERLDLPTMSDDLPLWPGAGAAPPPLPTSVDPGLPAMQLADDDERVSLEQAGRYTVKKVHGRGGQARVLLAFDEHIGRDVAIKELLTEPGRDGSGSVPSSLRSTPGMVRFLREARVTAQLEHPNIVPVHEVGRREDGTLYYTMRFVRGETLAKKLKSCRGLSERLKLLGAFWDLCNAIAYAHSRGVVHRDIKPENVMVGEFGETVLLDWGIAKVKGQKDIRARDLEKDLRLMHQGGGKTSDGTAIGTPSYMSPEQARGEIDAIDERSDVWGLGAVLYEILTGQPPFPGDVAMEIIARVGRDPVRPVAEVCPAAPRELSAICEKALRREPAQRYQSAREFAAEINAYMTGGKVGAYRYSSLELLKRFAAQNKAAIAAAGAALLIIVAALVLVSLALRNESQARKNESQAREREAAALAQEHAERLIAGYHLAQAYAEKAARLAEDSRFLAAAVFGAASLLHNPAHPGSPDHVPTFAESHLESRDLRVQAASLVFRGRLHSLLRLEKTVVGDEVFTGVAFSPKNPVLAAAGYDGKVRLWRVPDGGPAGELEAGLDKVLALAFAPDGVTIAAGGRNGTVAGWEGSARAERRLSSKGPPVQALRFSPRGDELAAALADGSVRVFRSDGSAQRRLAAHRGKANAVAFSPDGRWLATGGEDGRVRLWSLPGGKSERDIAGTGAEVLSLAFSPDGRRLAVGDNGKKIHLWNMDAGVRERILEGHSDGVLALAFSRDGRFLASAGYDKSIRLWEADTGELWLANEVHQNFVWGLDFSADGQYLASASFDRTVRWFRFSPQTAVVSLHGHGGEIYGMAFSPRGELATSGWDRSAIVWDLEARRPRLRLAGHGDVVDRVVFSPDGTLLATACRDRLVRLWDAQSGALVRTLRGHGDMVYGVAFSPDGASLATSGTDRTVRLWDVASGRARAAYTGHREAVDKVVFSPDGRILASASNDLTVRLWDTRTGEQLHVFSGHGDWISDVVFSPDGRSLATSSKDGKAVVWDAASGQRRFVLEGHAQWVNSVRFSPDGRWLATGSDDGTVRVWSADDGRPQLLIACRSGVVAIEFSPDSKLLGVGDGTVVRLYPLDFSVLDGDPKRLLSLGEEILGLRLDGFRLAGRP